MNRLRVVTKRASWVVWNGLEGVGKQYFSLSVYHAKWAELPAACADSYLLTHRSHGANSTWRALWTLKKK